MLKSVLALILALCSAVFTPIAAQSFSITYQNPDQLVVCASDTLRIFIQNNTAAPITGAFLDLELPTGLHYVAGSATGAADFDVSQPEQPVLALPTLLPGVSAPVQVQLEASCGLVSAINSAQLFHMVLRVRAGALTEQLTTAAFQIQTSLLVITQVDNDSVSGEKGQTILRTLHVQNTRLGPVKHLFLTDTHPAGISIHVPGALTEQDGPTQYAARFDGAFFTTAGDGDTLLEFGETILLREEITITDCGFPSYTCRSNLVTGWSCAPADPPCQGDTTYADVVVLPSTYEPKLTFQTNYSLPWSQCANQAQLMKVRVVNEGSAPATGIIVQLRTESIPTLSMEKSSFRIVRNGVITPITPSSTDDYSMPDCGVIKSAFATLSIPDMAGMDTLEIWFDAYSCNGYCKQDLPKLSLSYYHLKPCPLPPNNHVEADTVLFAAQYHNRLNGFVTYNIGACLDDESTYPFVFNVASYRLLTDTGFLWLKLDLPNGIFWSPDCPPAIGGKPPVRFSIDSAYTNYPINRVLMAFEMPFTDSALSMAFCLRSTCRDDASYTFCNGSAPDAAGNFIIYHSNGPPCGTCCYEIKTGTYLTKVLDDDLNCAIPACDSFLLNTVCSCDGGGGGGGGNGGLIKLKEYYQGARLNYDLPDNDDDRMADPAGALDLEKVRRDRFLPGDTIRNIFSTKIVQGDSVSNFSYQWFAEVIRSDFGYAGVFDTINIGPAQSDAARDLFTEDTMFEVARAFFTIWDSSANTEYTCPISPFGFDSELFGQVAQVNTKPLLTSDQLATMNYQFAPSLGVLGASGCVPPGLLLESGDSVALTIDVKLARNYAPFSKAGIPPLINFEAGYRSNSAYTFYNYRRADTLMFQYSGYFDSLTNNTFSIRPCDTSIQVLPFLYEIRLARPNLFPFEVRPLSQLLKYDLVILPPDIIPRSARLEYLNLQKNSPLLQKLPLPFFYQNGTMHLDFAPAYQSPIDEGYQLQTLVAFDPNCEFKAPDSSAQFITLQFPGCMAVPNVKTVKLENKIGFYSNHPQDTLTTDEPVLDFPTPQTDADLVLKNLAFTPLALAPNFWIRLVNPEGGLINFSLKQNGPPGTVYTAANGLFQLGKLAAQEQRGLHFSAVNTTCDPQRLLIIYGWNCTPVADTAAYVCSSDTLEMLLRPLNPEIELELMPLPTQIPLCDSSGYIVLELSNADLGYAYKPYVHIELPPGFQLVSGSCQIAYPAGSTYQSAPDPVTAGGNLLEWNLAALLPPVAANGLPGVNLNPQNAVQLRFKVQTECGVVSNAQLVFGARAEWSCGKATNTLRKASDPLLVEGVAPTYTAQISLTQPGGGPVPCNAERQLNLSLTLSGTALPGDSIYVTLPAGYAYVNGSYQPGANAPAGAPEIAGNLIRWPLPAGLPANTTIQFTFKVRSGGQPNCSGARIFAQTRQRATAFCPVINADCTVYIATGLASDTFGIFNPQIEIESAFAGINALGYGVYTLQVRALPPLAATLSTVRIVRDVDGNGQLSAADTLVYTGHPNQLLAGGLLFDINLISDHDPVDLCNLLAVLPAGENCDCENTVFPLQAGSVQHANVSLCLGETATVGIPQQDGHSYAWQGAANLPCTGCPELPFQPSAAGAYQLTLFDSGVVCTVRHLFSVLVRPLPTLSISNSTLCKGQSATLQTSAAVGWQWQGPGITDPGASSQTVHPDQTGTYAVTVTDATGCSLQATATIVVLPADTTDLGKFETCEGTSVNIFNQPVSTAGIYRDTLTNASGCDSLVLVELVVLPKAFTQELQQRCPEDTLLLFGHLPVAEAGTYSESYAAANGCDSTHQITVEDLPGPDLPPVDTFYIDFGGSVVLPGPGGYVNYQWMPADSLSCTTCQSPVASPIDTMAYTLTVTSANGCTGTLIYRVVPRPPCDPVRLRMPNAFTPDNDGTNDRFTVVPFEGAELVARLRIFNRWGQKVYDGTGPNAAWDGTVDGKPAPSDVYVWLLDVLCDGVPKKPRKGDVTLLR